MVTIEILNNIKQINENLYQISDQIKMYYTDQITASFLRLLDESLSLNNILNLPHTTS